MIKRLILGLAFVIPVAWMVITSMLVRSAGSSQPIGAFDYLGTAWIILRAVAYGIGGLAFAKAALYFGSLPPTKYALFLILPALIFFDSWRSEPISPTLFDQAIYSIGYLISRIIPYSATDAPVVTQKLSTVPVDSEITVRNKTGELKIITGKGLRRCYQWNSERRCVTLVPDSNGVPIYPPSFSSDRWPGYDWRNLDEITRFRGEELSLNFNSEEDAVTWIRQHDIPSLPLVFSNTGLGIAWRLDKRRHELLVLARKILINGKPAINLKNAEGSILSIKPLKDGSVGGDD